ncbi:MAG: hypothetical protein JNM27_21420 [Leptospirales bacterium]|nr:hypothetical protein [Leptospirales bacterium]
MKLFRYGLFSWILKPEVGKSVEPKIAPGWRETGSAPRTEVDGNMSRSSIVDDDSILTKFFNVVHQDVWTIKSIKMDAAVQSEVVLHGLATVFCHGILHMGDFA